MKYALIGYDIDGAIEGLAAEDKRALHGAHRALHDEIGATADTSVKVIAHYRFRPPSLVTNVRRSAGTVIASEGPATEASKALRALYVLESDDADAVLDLARRLPAVRLGGMIEIWPLTQPEGDESHPHSYGRTHRYWYSPITKFFADCRRRERRARGPERPERHDAPCSTGSSASSS
jgi:hypothetical protein